MPTLVLKEPSWKAIFLFVLIIHAGLILWLSAVSTLKPIPAPLPAPAKRISIKTVLLQPKLVVEEKAPLPPAVTEEPAPIESVLIEEKPLVESHVHIEPETAPEIIAEPTFIEPPKPLPKTPHVTPVRKTLPKPVKKLPQSKKVVSPVKKPIAKAARILKKTPPVKPKSKPAIAKTKPAKKSPANKIDEKKLQQQRTLLSRAKENMKKVASGNLLADVALAAVATPQKIEALQSDALLIDTPTVLNSQEISYRDELAHRLKLLMKLPEYGELQLKLTLDRSGKVVTVKILQSASKSNRTHVEKILPTLKMPAFGKNFGNQAEYTFSITMSNS
jgi:colicin import membrane protein